MTLPRIDDDRRAILFNRANHFRQLNEFDKAIAAYEQILSEDNADAEAHWGVVLSRHGIKYVEDPRTGERIPTCHRAQIASILADSDYIAALTHSPDDYTRSLYETEAQRIADMQRGILAISSREEPYDVFICYKETAESGVRTKDSAIAQDIYYQLQNEGYKVFFSRVTLEDKLGQQYEPYIFAALNSAKVMVVVGTSPENFHAVWVRNEWSRFLDLMKSDRHKLLIPCYRDMDPYDLPDALSILQSQDMGKIGFIQDLVRGIRKVLDTPLAKGPFIAESTAQASPSANAQIAPLLKRVALFLEDGDFKSADEYYERILDIDPECSIAYWGKLLAEYQSADDDAFVQKLQSLFTDITNEIVPTVENVSIELTEEQAAQLRQLRASTYLLDDDFNPDLMKAFPSGTLATYTAGMLSLQKAFQEDTSIRNHPLYKKALRFASPKESARYQGIAKSIEQFVEARVDKARRLDEDNRGRMKKELAEDTEAEFLNLEQLIETRRAAGNWEQIVEEKRKAAIREAEVVDETAEAERRRRRLWEVAIFILVAVVIGLIAAGLEP